MVKRRFWLERLEQQWRRCSILWVRGVRRAGKTWLAQSFVAVEYSDCTVPSIGLMRIVLLHGFNPKAPHSTSRSIFMEGEHTRRTLSTARVTRIVWVSAFTWHLLSA